MTTPSKANLERAHIVVIQLATVAGSWKVERRLVAQALDEAERRGAEAMRERAAKAVGSLAFKEPIKMKEYFLSRDNSGHLYVVPLEKSKEWHAWVDMDEDDPASWDVPEYAKRVEDIVFSNWREV